MRKEMIGIALLALLVCVLATAALADENTTDCPQLTPPAPNWCENGTVVAGGTNENGCPMPPTCHRDSSEDDETEISKETQKEAALVAYPFGAEVRLLQLEKAITANILIGNEIVKMISAKNTSADVSGLNSILNQMTALLTTVKAAPTTGTAEELAAQFVEFKSDARNLTKQFRETAKPLLSPGDIAKVRKAIKSQDIKLRNINESIQDAKREYNAARVQSILQSLGLNSTDELIAQVRNGTMSLNDVKGRLRQGIRMLTDEQKQQASLKLHEMEAKRAVIRTAVAQKAVISLEHRADRWTDYSNRLGNLSAAATALGLQKRAAVLDKLSTRAQVRGEQLIEKAGAVNDRLRARNGSGQLVGNDRDVHGCIGSAGYTWCEQKQKCVRPWEEDCTGLKQEGKQ